MRKTAIQTSGAFQRMQTSLVVSDVRLVEVALLRREAGQPRVGREAGVRPWSVGPPASAPGRRRREAGIEVVREVAGALMAREVGAVAGDVALPERVAAEQVVDARASRRRGSSPRPVSSWAIASTTRLLSSARWSPSPSRPRARRAAPTADRPERDQAIGGRDNARVDRVRRCPCSARSIAAGGGQRGSSRSRRASKASRGNARRASLRRPGRRWRATARPRPRRASSSRSSSPYGPAAERALIVGGQEQRLGRARPDGGDARPSSSRARVRGLVARTRARRARRRPRGAAWPRSTGGAGRASVGSSCGQQGSGAHSRAVHAVERHAGVRAAGRHLHPQQPVELPAALLEQQRLGRAHQAVRVAATAQQLEVASSCHTGIAPLVTYLPWSPASYQPPGDVEAARARPAGIQPLGVRAGPGRDAARRRGAPPDVRSRAPAPRRWRSRSAAGRRTPARRARARGRGRPRARTGGCAHRRPRPRSPRPPPAGPRSPACARRARTSAPAAPATAACGRWKTGPPAASTHPERSRLGPRRTPRRRASARSGR